jgi:RNA polymerase sigma factor for flagellar operon FliA
METLQELVEAYLDSPAPGLRNAIITRSTPLVRSIVGKISRPDNALTQFEDLQSAGLIGLLQALDGYRADQGVQFNTFAYYRIRGAVIDYLRKIDQLPRMQRSAYGKAQQMIDQLTQQLGREPEDEEVAKSLGLSLPEYHDVLMNVQQRALLSLDDQKYSDSPSETFHAFIEDRSSEQPDAAVSEEYLMKRIRQEIGKLKERDQTILALYYYEEMTLAEIAVTLGLTEARISQIVGKILLQLKKVAARG